MKAIAIVQARMGSSRLPGKVLMQLAGKPILWHIIHRLKKCRSLQDIVIATSTNLDDDPIADFANEYGVKPVRGPENNVLARFLMVAQELHPEVIVRITGDAPLIEPSMIDRLVGILIKKQVGYITGELGVPCIHEGVDPFTTYALEKLAKEAGHDPAACEHVSGYFKEHPEFVPIEYVPIDQEYQFSGARVSVDTMADIQFLESVYKTLNVRAGEAYLPDVVTLLKTKPELLDINTHVHQKKVYEKSNHVLFRCDGDTDLGLGHVYRCLALAKELVEEHGCGVTFAMTRGLLGVDLVKKHGYKVEHNNRGSKENCWIDEIVGRTNPSALIFDLGSNMDNQSLGKWRKSGILIITIDDPSIRRLQSDLAFYPPVPQLKYMDWTDFDGKLYSGWEWVILRKEFSVGMERSENACLKVLVTMGGSDPAGLTLKTISALDILDNSFETTVVIGPGFPYEHQLRDMISKTQRNFDIVQNAENMSVLMAQSDLGIASFGVTAYEMAAMALPSVFLCLTKDHEESATSFVKAGISVCLGEYPKVKQTALATSVKHILQDKRVRSDMVENAKTLAISNGTKNVAKSIMANVNKQSPKPS